jgi:mRNA interferase MazF
MFARGHVVPRSKVKVGRLWRAVGVEPAKHRPAVFVSDARFNRFRLSTVTVVAVTANVKQAQSPGNVALPKGTAGLDRPSVVNLTQLATLDRRRLVARSGALTASAARQVNDGLRLALFL